VRRQGQKDGGDEQIIPSMSGPGGPRQASSRRISSRPPLSDPEEGSEDTSTASGLSSGGRKNRSVEAVDGGSDGIERAASSRTLPVQEGRFDRLRRGVLVPATIAAWTLQRRSLEHACETQTPKEAPVCRRGGLGRSTRRFDRLAIETRGQSRA